MLKKIKENEKLKNNIKFILIMIALTIFASYPYLPEGTVYAHDLCYHFARILGTEAEISNGIFPVFIHSNLLDGLGYGNPLFYPELFLYIAILFMKLGFGVLFSYKMLLMITTFCTAMITFYSTNLITKDKKVSWITTLLYTLSLYRFVDIYARGALGEVLSFTFLPLIIAGLYDILWGENKRWYLICFAIFGVMNSHVLSFAMAVILILVLCFINIIRIFKDKKKILNITIAGIVSILLISSYMFTYIEQKMDDSLNVDVHKNSGQSLKDNASGLQEAFWNDLRNTDGYTTRSVGTLLLILPICLFMIKNKKERKEFKFFLELYILGLAVWVMSLNVFPWEKCTFLQIMQFPYRLNMISTLLFSFVAGYSVINAFENKEDIFKLLILVILLISAKHLSEVKLNENGINYEILMSGPLVANGEYKPVGFSEDDKEVYSHYKPEDKISFEKKGSKIMFDYNDKENNIDLHIPLTYYKGYVGYIINENGEKIDLKLEKDNTNAHLRIKSDKIMTGKITVEYKMTAVQKCGYAISIVTFISVISFIIYKNKKLIDKNENVNKLKNGKIIRKIVEKVK